MANNLLDRLLDITGIKPTGTQAAGSKSTDGLSGVERYLAKKAEAKTEQLAAEPVLSSVEKYLQRKAEAVAAPETSSKPASSVEKYLASKGRVPKAPAAKPKPASRVEKYLQEKTDTPKTASKPKPAAKKPAAAKKTVKPTVAPNKGAPKTSGARIDLSVGATQCQSGTARGGQCKRTKNLVKIQRTIHKQKYTFLVCSQHNNESFKPYKGLIEG